MRERVKEWVSLVAAGLLLATAPVRAQRVSRSVRTGAGP